MPSRRVPARGAARTFPRFFAAPQPFASSLIPAYVVPLGAIGVPILAASGRVSVLRRAATLDHARPRTRQRAHSCEEICIDPSEKTDLNSLAFANGDHIQDDLSQYQRIIVGVQAASAARAVLAALAPPGRPDQMANDEAAAEIEKAYGKLIAEAVLQGLRYPTGDEALDLVELNQIRARLGPSIVDRISLAHDAGEQEEDNAR